ncbi:hypothetical protein GCM10028796_46640 [Ramlibacter monticola]|uniref:Uncharacterized protein n=1 Tax=Ramlibacter monticola TaxID=1926872 RepID=A0A936Z5F4_9BURK|nr:hypothetical protein [Ramlibacter monticola]MBL0394289.1 hypothetical protein [Ramlibacter monticola]
MIPLAFLIAALVLAILATVNVPAGRYSLLAGSLACWFAALLAERF